jgi:hypothetical protein
MGDGAVRRPGQFVGRIALYQLEGHGGEWFCLLEDLTYIDEDGRSYTAPAGTLTDFASVPRPAWWIFPKNGKHSKAAVIHDRLCTERRIASPTVHAILRRAVRACRCHRVTQWSFWLAVRLFGPRFEAS